MIKKKEEMNEIKTERNNEKERERKKKDTQY